MKICDPFSLKYTIDMRITLEYLYSFRKQCC